MKKLKVVRRPKCEGWYIRPTENGKTMWIRLSDKKTEAVSLAADYARQRELKKHEGFNSQADIDLALEKYLRHKFATTLTTKKSKKKYDNTIRFFQEFMRSQPIMTVAEINRDIVVSYLEYRKKTFRISDSSWNIDRTILVNFFNYCVDNKWTKENPAIKIPKKRIVDHIPAHLSEQEAKALLDYAKQTKQRVPYYELFATLLYTGMRLGEALMLTKKDVLLEKRLLWITEKVIQGERWTPKTKKSRYVPISDELLPIIKKQVENKSEFLFPNTKGQMMKQRVIYDVLVKYCRRAGLPRVHIHSMRHSFCSIATEKGYAEPIIQEVLGHATAGMTRRYRHLKPEFLGEKFKGLKYGQS